jgi:phage tail-like protein
MPAFGARAWRGTLFAVLVISILGVAGVQGQGTTTRKDALPAFSFRVEIEGVDLGTFRSVSGLSIEMEVIEFREGGSEVIHKLPGVRKYPNLVLKQGFTGNIALYDWFISNTRQNPVRVDGKIVMLDQHDAEVAAWQFHNGFPAKWEGPDFDASGNDIPIETIEIAHEGLTMITPGRP